jgi:hypothetical protein
MAKIFFAIVLLHLVAGFGWLIYKLGFSRKNDKKE